MVSGSTRRRGGWWLLAAALVICRAGAGPLEWLAGDDDVLHGAVPEPTDGMLPSPRPWARDQRPGLVYRWHNAVPLGFRRLGRPAGDVDSVDHRLSVDDQLAGGVLSLAAALSENHAELLLADGRSDLDWREARRTVGYHRAWGDLTLGGGWEERRTDLRYDGGLGGEPFAATALTHGTRWWLLADYRDGAFGAGLAAGPRGRGGPLRSDAIRPNSTLALGADGWQLAARLEWRPGGAWRVAAAGTYRRESGRGPLRLGTVRHGTGRPRYEEWRLALEADGPLSDRWRWWGTLFGRGVRSELTGGLTAIAPPLGSLTGPRWRLGSSLRWHQAGLATGVTWSPAERTRLSTALRVSSGDWVGGYRLTAQDGPGEIATELSATNVNQTILLGSLSLLAEQRIGSVWLGCGAAAGLAATDDHLAGGAPSSGGVRLTGEVPVAFWLRAPL